MLGHKIRKTENSCIALHVYTHKFTINPWKTKQRRL